MNDAPYGLVVARTAAATIAEKLPQAVATAVLELISGPLLENPQRIGVELRNELEGLWSARRGTYRVIYRIDEVNKTIEVVRVSHRRDAYRSD
ncbi:type II toxin-antitoxin system RelE family toxin [Candidatus Poriferisocius sp.]|uniref:type II toxin-antitoxin system RelE family toxin n=1 Tax=Candidatus Poriferisocius sp. TaxID=3101276 RepID=UPI003B523169